MNLEQLSAAELGRRMATGELSSRSVTEYFLNRIEQLDGSLQSFVHVDPVLALADAEAVDQRLAQKDASLSPLAGVPIALKDILCVRGVNTTCGSRMLEQFKPPYDAGVVERLRRAGLVLLGKTNLDEFAMGGSTETSIFGATRNPWDTLRTAGGSSGGSAAALAAGLAPLSIGTDTGGSVRQPAAFCGVLGLKPTYGRISRYGLIAFASSLDQVGPFAHYAEDLALLMAIIAGHDDRDSTSLSTPAEDYHAGLANSLKGLRVGVLTSQLSSEGVHPQVRKSVEATAAALRDLGATTVDVELPHAKYSVATYYLIAPSEASSNLARYDGAHYGYRAALPPKEASLEAMYCQTRSAGFGAEVKRRIMLGTFALSSGYYDAYYRKALQLRRLIYDDYQAAFASVDCVLGPTTPSTAFGIG
ncbi:MAG: Asp-tRNA(Asn)/Glu-tRNA(Gln) amidotransferase subunit GatA, partial [Pirellulaceae bacterium]|nr:Asp-tRNA(Asn)/Glu-tRNA(Gln) amidotransferase subunit GatA [Pirellulaceae bacterium]